MGELVGKDREQDIGHAVLTCDNRAGCPCGKGVHVWRVAHKKPNLPSKPCATCGRPFTWRKKWERVWDEVKYCSKRCQNEKKNAR